MPSMSKFLHLTVIRQIKTLISVWTWHDITHANHVCIWHDNTNVQTQFLNVSSRFAVFITTNTTSKVQTTSYLKKKKKGNQWSNLTSVGYNGHFSETDWILFTKKQWSDRLSVMVLLSCRHMLNVTWENNDFSFNSNGYLVNPAMIIITLDRERQWDKVSFLHNTGGTLHNFLSTH